MFTEFNSVSKNCNLITRKIADLTYNIIKLITALRSNL